MKVCISNKYGTFDFSKTGKGFFVQRLCSELEKLGIETTANQKDKVDIDMQISHMTYWPENATKRIIRRGPVKYDINMDYKKSNHEDWKYMKQCHGIVYQSEFSKRMNDAFLGLPREGQQTAIIFNGADPEYYEQLKPYPSKFKYNYLASTREWVWEKHLEDIIESFLLADIKDSCLWIAGTIWDKPKRFPPFQKDYPKKYKRDNIKFLGGCDEQIVGRLYLLCNAMIHLVYNDACPNAVAEAVCAGLPVIASNSGGQAELVHPVINLPPVPTKAYDRRKQPKIDRSEIAKYLVAYIGNYRTFGCDHVNICTIAKQYAEFFEKVLHE